MLCLSCTQIVAINWFILLFTLIYAVLVIVFMPKVRMSVPCVFLGFFLPQRAVEMALYSVCFFFFYCLCGQMGDAAEKPAQKHLSFLIIIGYKLLWGVQEIEQLLT